MKLAASAALFLGATFTESSLAGQVINVTAPGSTGFTAAKADAEWGLTGCVITAGVTTVTCPTPGAFTTTGTVAFVADDMGATTGGSPERIPFVTTATVTNAGGTSTLTLSAAPTFGNTVSGITTPVMHVNAFDVSGTLSTGYEFGSTQTLNCSGSTCTSRNGRSDALGSPATMAVIPSTVTLTPSVGSGATSTSCVLTSTTQTAPGGAFTQFAAVTSGGTLFSVSDISAGADRISNDSMSDYSGGYYTEPLSGCGFTTLPQVKFKYTVLAERILRSDGVIFTGTGVYPIAPPCPTAADSTGSSDAGMNLKLTCEKAGEILPGMVAFGTDNTVALQAMIASTSNAASMNRGAAIGQPVCLYFPTGNYLLQPLNQSGSTLAQGYGCFYGDEHYHSNLFVNPNTAGDVIAWLNSNGNNSLQSLGSTQLFAQLTSGSSTGNQAGATFRQMTIIGDRLSTAEQNGLAFYGRTDWAFIDDIIVNSMRGSGLIAGISTGTSILNDFDESIIRAARFEQDGDDTPPPPLTAVSPAVEITATGTASDGSNGLNIDEMRIYQSFGAGLRIHNSATSAPTTSARDIRIANLEVEGSGLSATDQGGPLLQLGDPGLSSNNVANVLATNLELVNPVLGYPALLITGAAATNMVGIDIEGLIEGALTSPGSGVQVVACQQCSVRLATNSSADYNLEIGTPQAGGGCSGSFITAPGVTYDGAGAESTMSSCVDPAALTLLHFPARQTYYSTSGNPSSIPFPAKVTEPVPPGAVAAVANASGNTTYTTSGRSLPTSYLAPLWVVYRVGATATFSDAWDTAADIIGALNTESGNTVTVGQVFHAEVCNQTAYSGTVTPSGVGDTGSAVTLNAGTCANFALTITDIATPGITIIGE